MRVKRAMAYAILSAAAVGVPASAAFAGKRSGGGGGGPPPVGTICFQDQSTVAPWPGSTYPFTYGLIGMDGNGGARTPFPRITYSPHMSRRLHAGMRWILTIDLVDVPSPNHDVFAIRQDGALRVRLTSDPLTEVVRCVDWAPDEDESGATIGFVARRFTDSSRTAVAPGSCGLYAARVTFDASGNVTGLAAAPILVLPLPTRTVSGVEFPDVKTFCWAPDMSRIAFERVWETSVFVADFARGTVTNIGPGEAPDWSPDGSKIACVRSIPAKKGNVSAIVTVRSDGSAATTVVSVAPWVDSSHMASLGRPKWAPDGAYLAFDYVVAINGLNWMHHVYRVGADGVGVVNLTPEVPPQGTILQSGDFGSVLVDWR